MHPILLLLASLVFVSAGHARAIPVTLEIAVGSDANFSFPRIHTASGDPITLETNNGEVTFYRDGVGPAVTVIEPLTAEVTATSLTFTGGVLRLADGATLPDFEVTGGTLSFAGVPSDTFAGTLETSSYGTFYFLLRNWASAASIYPPNSYEPFGDPDGFVSLWANNWDRPELPPPDQRWGMDAAFLFPAIPEPGCGLLVGVGLLALAYHRRAKTRYEKRRIDPMRSPSEGTTPSR